MKSDAIKEMADVSRLSRLHWWRCVSAWKTREHLIDAAHPGRTLCARVTLIESMLRAYCREKHPKLALFEGEVHDSLATRNTCP